MAKKRFIDKIKEIAKRFSRQKILVKDLVKDLVTYRLIRHFCLEMTSMLNTGHSL